MLRIASWNVNGIQSLSSDVLGGLAEQADLLALQEVRTAPPRRIDGHPYVYWSAGQIPGRDGVLTSSITPAVATHADPIIGHAGRSLLTAFADYSVLNLYVPHGGRDFSRYPAKVDFLKRTLSYLAHWEEGPLIVAGDFNVATDDLDLARPRANRNSVMYTSELRELMMQFAALGFIDSFRRVNPEAQLFSWWPYAYNARERNVGWRIDYILAHARFSVVNSTHLVDTRGSDHCPIVTSLSLQPKEG